MKYLLLCCFNEQQWDAISQAQRDTIMRDYGDLLQNLRQSGHHLATAKLKSSSAATTIRRRDGKIVITDGPFAETKEQLGGYHLIECADVDEALAIAKRIPTLPFGGTIELRPLEQEYTQSATAS